MNFSFVKDINNDVYMGDNSSTQTYVTAKLNEGFRSTELTQATIEQRQESGKTVLEIEGPLSKSTFEKVKKMISNTKQKSVGEEASKQEQIEEFQRKYKSFNDVPVKDMRHIIPLLLMEVYVEKHGQYTKKVKGLWEKRPDDWPEKIPFVDPNNSMKNESTKKNVKPKKELLGQMLTYLVDRYMKMKSVTEESNCYLMHADDPLLSFPLQSTMQNDDLSTYELNLIETNDSELRAAEQSVGEQSFSTGHSSGLSLSFPGYTLVFHQDVKPSLSSATNDGSIDPSSLSTVDDPLSGGMDVEHGELVEDGPGGSGLRLQWFKQPDLDAKPPEQVVDNEEETSSGKDWNPLEEFRERTKLKLAYMKTNVPLPKGVQNQLENIHGMLKNLTVSVVDDEDTLKLIENWSQLERCIDIAKFQKPCKCSDMIRNLHDELVRKMVPSMDFMDNNTMKCKSVDLPDPEEDLQQFNSLLNIRPRPGPAGGRILFPSSNQLELRSLATDQSASNNGCMVSTLSDNHKPVQLAQEDREDQKSEKPEFNEVTRNEPLPFSISDDELREIFSQIMGQDVPQLSQDVPQLSQEMPQLSQEMPQLSQEMSQLSQEMSCPIQESAPLIESTSQLVGKFEMPVDSLSHMMTGVSVQPWVYANPTMMSTQNFVFSTSPTVVSAQPIPNHSIPSPTFAEECISRLSLSANRYSFPAPAVQTTNPCTPVQPLLDQLLCRPRAGGRPGNKRCRTIDEDDELDENVSGPSKPAKAPTYNMMIPLVVEEISNNLDKPFPRLLKKRSR